MLDWEVSKENYQPLKQGRNVTQLKDTSSVRKADVEDQRRALWKDISNYSGDDALEPWLRLIKWTQHTFKSGGHQAELRPILERCTRELSSIESYKTDLRYLRVWIHYADCLPEPQDVFGFLQTQGIGQDFALFYVAYAAFLELRRNYGKAESVLQAGLDRMAYPVDKLQAKYDAFQARMARRAQRDAGGCLDETDLAGAHENGQRSALACIQGPSVKKGTKKASSSTAKENSSGLEVFVDEEFGGGRPERAAAKASSQGASAPSWTKLATFEQTRKENVQAPGKWTDNAMHTNKALAVPVPPKMDIPMDEELRAKGTAPCKAAVPQGTLRHRLERMELDEHLQADPLKLHKNQHLAATMAGACGRPPRVPGPVPPFQSANKAPSKSDANSPMGYDAQLLQGPDGEEMSFEEVRAAAWHKAQRDQEPACGTTSSNADAPAPAADAADNQVTGGPKQSPPAIKTSADVTSSVRAAFSAVNAMFGGSVPSQQAPPAQAPITDENCAPTPKHSPGRAAGQVAGHMGLGDEAREPGRGDAQALEEPQAELQEEEATSLLLQAASEGDVTVATRNAYNAINCMFHGALDSQVPWHTTELSDEHTGALAAACQRAACDPTITLSTKAAFEALGGAFASRLPHEDTRKLAMARPPGSSRAPQQQPPPPPTGPASGSGQDATGTFAVWEDTGLLNGDGEATGFAVHEDTTLFGKPQQLAARDQDQLDGFACYEDTEFVGGVEGMHARDTATGLPPTVQQEVMGTSPVSNGFTHGNAEDSFGFQVYEDTGLL